MSVKNMESNDRQPDMPSIELLEAELRREKYRRRFRRTLRRTLLSLVVIAAIAVIIAVLLMPVLQISGSSMENTLSEGDFVLALNNGKYKSGDIIGFYLNNGILIKRVIACPGDWVDMDGDGSVYVNGSRLDEPYLTEKSVGECNITLPFQVPEGTCFVMGDQRTASIDSRNTAVGCVPDDAIIGKLFLRFWPLERFGIVS